MTHRGRWHRYRSEQAANRLPRATLARTEGNAVLEPNQKRSTLVLALLVLHQALASRQDRMVVALALLILLIVISKL